MCSSVGAGTSMGLGMRLGTGGQRQTEQQLTASLSAEAKTKQQAFVNICDTLYY